MSRPILVGFDGSESACDALTLGHALADALDARLLVVTAYTPAEGQARGRPPRPDEARRELVAERALAALGERREVELRAIPLASAAAALHSQAEQLQAEMVVVGSTRRRRLGQLRAGVVTAEVLHGSPCPVAVAPAGLRSRGVRCDEIGVGFDDGPAAHAALRWSESLANRAKAHLSLLWAVDLFVDRAPELERDGGAGYFIRMRAELEEALARAAAGIGGARVVGTELLEGEAVEALVRDSARFDLLVLGSRGYGPLRRVLLGSVSRSVVARSGCPVIVVPRAAGAPRLLDSLEQARDRRLARSP